MSKRRNGRSRKIWFFAGFALVSLLAVVVFAKNGWFPTTDAFTGKKTGWFKEQLPNNASSSWNPFAAPLPIPTPQLAREYLYAGSRLLSVVDANAHEAPPADLAVWRPSTGTWWVMGGQNSQGASQGWGLQNDKPVPGDYDGDGKTDFSVFRPPPYGNGEWYVLQSSDGSWLSVVAWGNGTDKLVPADYDGDGKTDRAVWRPADGIWYIIRSSDGGSYYETYGQTGDIPAPADYDGDGRADIGVWRNSTKTFYSINSSNLSAQTVGTSIQPGTYDWHTVSSDYDGDGHADYALYNKSTATWYLRNSNGSITTTAWGNAGDEPVQNDYDGDAKTDLATWRDANGNWSIRQSSLNNLERVVQWGISGDKPVPSYYRR